MGDYEDRFGGVARVLGEDGLGRVRRAHVCVIGLGGVGSWVVEALARSGVGELTLVDLDDVCISNLNRQLPALDSTVGRAKAEVLAARAADINPALELHPCLDFFTVENADRLLAPRFDVVVDAIDSPSLKARLIAACRERGLHTITAGGAGGRHDPTRIRVADLAESSKDPLLAQVRSLLRKHHGFPRDGTRFGVDCVFSSESLRYPKTGAACAAEAESSPADADGSACERRYGAVSFVTGAFGFAAAAQAITVIAGLPGLATKWPGVGRRAG